MVNARVGSRKQSGNNYNTNNNSTSSLPLDGNDTASFSNYGPGSKSNNGLINSNSLGNAMTTLTSNGNPFPEISTEERQQLRKFWFALTDQQRKNLCVFPKEAIIKKLKDSRSTRNCQCPCCGRSK